MQLTDSSTALYLIAGVAALVALVLAVAWWRAVRGRDEESAGHQESEPVDEITQPLPVMDRTPAREPATVHIKAAARTDPGKVRPVNEDDILLALPEGHNGSVAGAGLFAVADGMGGHEKGEVASRTAVEATIEAIQSHPFFAEGQYHGGDTADEAVLEVLRSAVLAANRAVYRARVDHGSDMGTTLVLALVLRGKAYVANVGDSRAYLLRNGTIRQITEDHSLVERMIASGQITDVEARRHPQRNLIYRTVGSEPHVDADLFVEPLQPGDRLLLCSDGLSSMVPDNLLADLAYNEEDVDRACRLLIRAANDAGGNDNISVVLAEIQRPSSTDS